MHLKIVLRVATCAAVSAIASAATAQSPETSFNLLRVGDAREIIISAMGEPISKTEGATLGVPVERLRWRAGSRTYTVSLIAHRLVSKRACDRAEDCQ